MDTKKEKQQGNEESSTKKERHIVTWTQEVLVYLKNF